MANVRRTVLEASAAAALANQYDCSLVQVGKMQCGVRKDGSRTCLGGDAVIASQLRIFYA